VSLVGAGAYALAGKLPVPPAPTVTDPLACVGSLWHRRLACVVTAETAAAQALAAKSPGVVAVARGHWGGSLIVQRKVTALVPKQPPRLLRS
ncbi:MAG: hypothetical protein JXQ75_23755, partial [Phycisphaerae bacterium]|nr:hypothetical protein [Phycisphaerae bacterium]